MKHGKSGSSGSTAAASSKGSTSQPMEAKIGCASSPELVEAWFNITAQEELRKHLESQSSQSAITQAIGVQQSKRHATCAVGVATPFEAQRAKIAKHCDLRLQEVKASHAKCEIAMQAMTKSRSEIDEKRSLSRR